jgi:glycolate oxidase subunit GlcD
VPNQPPASTLQEPLPDTSAGAARDALVAGLGRIVGGSRVLNERSRLIPYQSDGLPTYHQLPALAVFPGTRAEAIAVVRELSTHGAAFVPRGAGTGLSGGALSDSTVLLGLNRLRTIMSLDTDAGIATVEPGVVNSVLTRLASASGLHFAPDPSSQSACTIGGNLAENAGGPHCLKYGVTLNHVLAATVILPDGSIVSLGSVDGEREGYDLLGAFVGSEGCFGVALDVTVRLTRNPQAVRTLLADFTSVVDAARATSAIIAAGIVPAALEMMDAPTIRAVEASIYAAGYPADAAAVLLVELDGLEAGIDTDVAAVRNICASAGARGVRIARDAAERALLWQGRKKAFGAMGRVAPQLVVQDAVVPRTKLPEILEEIHRISQRHNVMVCNVFHAGDGNLHPNIPYNAANEDESHRVHLAMTEIMHACIDAGGTVTGEHGIGLDKLAYMDRIFSPASMDAMCRLRDVFDPERRCNPGKVVPVHSCREWHATPSGRDGGGTGTRASRASAGATGTGDSHTSAGGTATSRTHVSAGATASPGARSPHIVSPEVQQLAERIREAHERAEPVRLIGGGSWLDAGRPVVADATPIHFGPLRGIVEYTAGDLAITVRAGTPLSELDAALREQSQWLPLDPPAGADATVGATFATASAGPLSHGFGTPRDLVLGIEFVDGLGSVIRAGGRVTKNVAGFDLVRLMTGAWGTLGVITELTLRLRALPQVDETVVIALPERSAEIAALIAAVRRAPLEALAMEIVNAPLAARLGIGNSAVLIARLAGNAESVVAQQRTIRSLGDCAPVSGNVWERLRAAEPAGAAVWRRSARSPELAALWEHSVNHAAACGAGALIHATVGRGVARCILPDPDPDAIAHAFNERSAGAPAMHNLIFEKLPDQLWTTLAPLRDHDSLNQRVRAAFDPAGIMNRGILGQSNT